MALPELVHRSAEKILTRYCFGPPPASVRDQRRLSFSIRDDQVTLFAERAECTGCGTQAAAPVARFRFNHELGQWTLHYPDGERRWRFSRGRCPTRSCRPLLGTSR